MISTTLRMSDIGATATMRLDANFWIACRAVADHDGIHLESERGRALIAAFDRWCAKCRPMDSRAFLRLLVEGVLERGCDPFNEDQMGRLVAAVKENFTPEGACRIPRRYLVTQNGESHLATNLPEEVDMIDLATRCRRHAGRWESIDTLD
jgi:hypothetical protein